MRELGYFAALYADKVWYSSPFTGLKDLKELDDLRLELAFYLSRLNHQRPLFDAGLLSLAPFHSSDICRDCYSRLIGSTNNEFSRRLNKLEKSLRKRCLSEVDFYVEQRGQSGVALIPRGPSTLIDEHYGGRFIVSGAPEGLLEFAKSSSSRTLLPKRLADKLDVPAIICDDILNDIMNQNLYANRYGTGYLTQREIDLELATELLPIGLRRKSEMLNASFSHELPLLGGIHAGDLVRFRQSDGDAFQVYRDALSQAISEVSEDSPNKFQQAFDDVVRPEIHRISARITSARRTLVKDFATDALVATGFVGVGLFSGVLPANIGPVIAALGGYHFFRDAGRKLSELILDPPDVRDSSFHFLWKVANHGRQ